MKHLIEKCENLGFALVINEELLTACCTKLQRKEKRSHQKSQRRDEPLF